MEHRREPAPGPTRSRRSGAPTKAEKPVLDKRSAHYLICISIACLTLASACTNNKKSDEQQTRATEQEAKMNYPETKREAIVDTLHGKEVADPYRWLEDVEGPGVKEWMRSQDDFTRDYLGKLPARDWLAKRFAQLYYIDAVGTPIRRKDRFFLYRRAANQEKYVVYYKDGEGGEEKLLLDPNTMSEDGSVSLGGMIPSPDGKLVAYKLKENNADEATMYVMNVDTGETSEIDVITGAKYAYPSWMPDNSGFYYTWLPPVSDEVSTMDRPGFAEVRYHQLGADPKSDKTIIEKSGDPKTFIGAGVSRDGKYLFRYIQRGWNSTDVYYRPLDGKHDDKWLPIAEGLEAQFDLTVWKDKLYVLTNWNAPNYRVLKLDMSDPDLTKGVEIVPTREDAVLDGAQVIGERLVLNYMQKAHSKLAVHDLDGAHIRDIALPTIGATGGLSGEPDAAEAYFTFTSFTVPNQIFSTNVETGATELWAKIDIPVDPTPYKVEQVTYNSKDGTPVTMFVVTRKDIELNGETPFILYGYGGFNVSMKPYFRSHIYPWLELGGGYAVANLRGGGEYGEAWHQAGMLVNKQNVFDDFVAAAEFLIDKGYTTPEHLGISGGSNGGLLVGATMTQRPELFNAVLCAVPLLDMVRYHLSGSGKTWIPEYGSADDPEQFAAIHAYSPYHNVTAGTDYPPTLIQSADSDDRVDPSHARKFAAMLQWANPDADPMLLRIEENAGHGGGDMVSKRVEGDVDEYAFLIKHLGIDTSSLPSVEGDAESKKEGEE